MNRKTILVFATMLIFISCNKDEDRPVSVEQMVQGKWKINSIKEEDSGSIPPYSNTYPGLPDDYVDFRTDGNVYWYSDGIYDTFTYRVVNDQYIIEEVADTFNILTISNNRLIRQHTSALYKYTEDLYK